MHGGALEKLLIVCAANVCMINYLSVTKFNANRHPS